MWYRTEYNFTWQYRKPNSVNSEWKADPAPAHQAHTPPPMKFFKGFIFEYFDSINSIVINMQSKKYVYYSSIGYVWRGEGASDLKYYTAPGSCPPVCKFLDPPLSSIQYINDE